MTLVPEAAGGGRHVPLETVRILDARGLAARCGGVEHTHGMQPDGWHTLTPRIVTDDVAGLFEFLRRTFDAGGELAEDRPTIARIGDSRLMLSEAGPRPKTGAFLYVYVADADATYRRAVAAGARVLEAPLDTPYGDRRAMVEDRWGNVWQIATPPA